MSSKNKNEKTKQKNTLSQPWIPMKTGIIVIAITSVAMVIFTMWQAVPIGGWYEGTLLGLAYGGMIWIVFLIMLLVHRFLRR